MAFRLNFFTDTLSTTLAKVGRAFDGEYNALSVSSFLRTNLLYPLRNITARIKQQLIELLVEVASQATPMGATGENLAAWLRVLGVQIPPSATATGSVDVTATDFTINAQTTLGSAGGQTYTTNASATFSGTEVKTIAITATDIGSAFNRAPGDKIFISISDAVDPEAVVVSLVGGSDPADDTNMALLLQAELSQSDRGGTASWYRAILLGQDLQLIEVFTVPAGNGAGTILLFPINRLTALQDPWEINVASVGQVAALQTFVDDEEVRKVNDRPFVEQLTVTLTTFNITITPNDAATQAAVTDSLGNRLAEAYSGRGYTVPFSELSGAVATAPGVSSSTINDVGGGGQVDVVAVVGEAAQLSTPITFS